MYYFCNFGRGHYGEHLCDFFLEFGPVVWEMLIINVFWFLAHLAQRSGTVCAILVEGFMGNILWNCLKFGPAAQEISFKKKIYI